MNPGYVARNELPDNVKSMFRPIAMVLPDYRLVSENLLYSLGFHKAPECA
jgi:dynein heavy chain